MEVWNTLLKVMYDRGLRPARRRYKKYSAVLPAMFGVVLVFLCALGVSGGSRALIRTNSGRRIAEKLGMGEVQAAQTLETENIQSGVMGVVKGAMTMNQYSQAANAIEMSSANEEILIGAARASRSEVMRSTVEKGTKESAKEVFSQAKQLIRETQMPASEYNTLLRIVEAEATGEDLEGKMLIANVILNRVADERFPDTIEEVVWQEVDGCVQFQPTYDGRFYTVEISDDTIEAVDRVLAGEDQSQGALYFMARMSSEEYNVNWFDENLIPLFRHGGHEYYTLSKEAIVS
ncbi:MAG: cell wall hydrolase [Muricoprocola sp.]